MELVDLLKETNKRINELIAELEGGDSRSTQDVVDKVLSRYNMSAKLVKQMSPLFYNILIDFANAYVLDNDKEDKKGFKREAKVDLFIKSIIKSGGASLNVFSATGEPVRAEKQKWVPPEIIF